MLAIAASQAGRITALVDSRFYPLVASNVLLGLGFAVVLFAPGLVLATVGIAVLGVGFGVTLSLYRSIVTGLAGPSLRAGLVSLSEAGSRLSTTLTPIAMGGVIALVTPQYGFGVAIRLAGAGAAAIAVCGGLGCLWIARQSPKTPAERDAGSGRPTDRQ
jgi:MFS family permease